MAFLILKVRITYCFYNINICIKTLFLVNYKKSVFSGYTWGMKKRKTKAEIEAQAKAEAKARSKKRAGAKKAATLKRKEQAKAKAKQKPHGGQSKYNPKWVKQIPELFLDGSSIQSVARMMGIPITSFNVYRKEYPEFGAAVEEGIELAKGTWQDIGLFWARRGSAAFWVFTMKNRYGWQDKVEIVDKDSRPPIELDESMSPQESSDAYDQLVKEIV